MKIVKIADLVSGEYTYPNWSSGSVYPLESYDEGDETIVKYTVTNTIMRRPYSRRFPKEILLTTKLCWALGFLKGEGMNSRNPSSYHRFGVTNKDSKLINFVLDELFKSGLLKKENIPDKSFQILHCSADLREVQIYWAKKLGVPKSKIRPYDNKHIFKKSKYGICHFYITDVLLRRIVDLVHEKEFCNGS